MPRTTSSLVGGIIEVDANIDLDPFIVTANALLNKIADDTGHDATHLELIERYLAAHFYTLRDPRYTQERAGPVGASYQSKVDLNLATSHYGQTAMVLDTSGELAALNQLALKGGQTVSLTWLGTED